MMKSRRHTTRTTHGFAFATASLVLLALAACSSGNPAPISGTLEVVANGTVRFKSVLDPRKEEAFNQASLGSSVPLTTFRVSHPTVQITIDCSSGSPAPALNIMPFSAVETVCGGKGCGSSAH